MTAPTPPKADPDTRARTHLANERTFLAWFRTGVTLIALGLAAGQFLTRGVIPGIPFTRGLAVVIVVAGMGLLVAGRRRYLLNRVRIEEGAFQPAATSVQASVAVFLAVGVLAIIFIAFLTTPT